MIIDTKNALLYIHPKNPKSKKPVIDDVWYKLYNLMCIQPTQKGHLNGAGKFFPGLGTKGYHECTGGCNRESGAMDVKLSNGLVTNTMALHYLAYHRDEVPREELNKIALETALELSPDFVKPNDEIVEKQIGDNCVTYWNDPIYAGE